MHPALASYTHHSTRVPEFMQPLYDARFLRRATHVFCVVRYTPSIMSSMWRRLLMSSTVIPVSPYS